MHLLAMNIFLEANKDHYFIIYIYMSTGYKLYLPTVFVGQEALECVSVSKYLGFIFSDSKCDDCDMMRRMRSIVVC